LWTVEDKLRIYSLKLDLMTFKNLADMSSRNVYDFSYEQKATVWLRIVYSSIKNPHCFLLNKLKERCVVSLGGPRFLCVKYGT